MTWYIYIFGIIAVALLTLGALDRLNVDLPGPLSWVGSHAWSAAAALAGLATGLLLRGREDSATDGGKAKSSGSDLPGRPPVEEVETSSEVDGTTEEAAEAVESDGLENSLADEVEEQAEAFPEIEEQ